MVTTVNQRMMISSGSNLRAVTIVARAEYAQPLIDARAPSASQIRNKEDLRSSGVTDVSNIVSLGMQSYQSKSGSDLSLGGDRAGGTLYIVDGVQLRSGSGSFPSPPMGAIDQVRNYVSGIPGRYGDASGGIIDQETNGGRHYLSSRKSKDFLNNFMANMMAASGLRKEFRDWAIWEPNLWTNSDGTATFNVKYPDNTTSWKTYVLAMNRDGYSGKLLKLTRSFKPLSAQLSAPRFLRYGDTVMAIGKVSNYTQQPFHIRTVLLQDGNPTSTDTGTVHNTKAASLRVTAPVINSEDTVDLSIDYSMTADNGYTDGEERILPILPIGVTESKGDFVYLNNDTTVTSIPDSLAGRFSGHARVYVDGSLLEVMLREIENLKVYPHGCNEQLTTKLLSIYYEEAIKKLLGETKFNNTKVKRQILDQLIRAQRNDGGFGWWTSNAGDARITNYIISTMQKINNDGWLDYIIHRGLNYLNNHLEEMTPENRIASLSTLSAAHYAANYKPVLDEVNKTQQNLYNQFAIVKICKEQGLPYRKLLDTLMLQREESINGCYWKNNSYYDWYRDDLATTLMAYHVVKGDSTYGKFIPAITRYLLFRRQHGYYDNTASSGLVLTTLLPDLLAQKPLGDRKKTTYIKITGSLKDSVTSFPKTYAVKGDKPVFTFKKQGISPAYVSVVYDYFNINPVARDTDFGVHNYFLNAKADTLTSLKAGEKITLRVTVNCRKAAEYVMIEVPIPAGCIQVNKTSSYYRGWIESAARKLQGPDRHILQQPFHRYLYI